MALDKRNISIFALCIYLALICILCFIRPSDLPDTPLELWGIAIDKIVHFLMFAPFPILAYFALSAKTKYIILIFIAGCIFSLGTEYIQGLTDYRSFEWKDLAADTLGLLSGSALTLIHSTLKNKRNNDK